MWGNMNAFYAGLFIFVGSVIAASIPEISVTGTFPTNVSSIFRWINILIGLLIMFIEYPRSARRSGKSNVERPGQQYIAPFLHILWFFGSNYIVRFLFYLGLMLPPLFVLSSIFGSICLFCAVICYFFAALNGEKWKAPSLAWGPGRTKKDKGPRVKEIPKAPSEPPPRLPTLPPTEAPSEPPPRPI
jgi:hypothetical protein